MKARLLFASLLLIGLFLFFSPLYPSGISNGGGLSGITTGAIVIGQGAAPVVASLCTANSGFVICPNGLSTQFGTILSGTSNMLGWTNQTIMIPSTDGDIRFRNNAGTAGITMNFNTNSRATLQTLAQAAGADWKFQNRIADGAAPGIAGCTASIGAGAANSTGTFTSGTNGACTVTLTFATTAPTGWSCSANDETTANLYRQTTGGSQTTAILTGTTLSGDVISYSCTAY